MRSRPSWARELKLSTRGSTRRQTFVAPFVGAWIETLVCHRGKPERSQSCPSWARELKRIRIRGGVIRIRSRAPRGRVNWNKGLQKPLEFMGIRRVSHGHVNWNDKLEHCKPVKRSRPHVGAWIEIRDCRRYHTSIPCRASRGRVNWNDQALFEFA